MLFKIAVTRKNNIYVFDIDNTVCDTWRSLPRLKVENSNFIEDEKKRIGNLKIFKGMQEHIQKIYKSNNNLVIYLSLRPIFLWLSTKKYLKKYNILDSLSNLILVHKIDDKFTAINLLNKFTKAKIIFYDDLSYNHEYGNVLYYDKLINKLKKLDIIYFDYHQILKIQQRENE
tara:strand:+ start:410 stop:928 length:519 start_codon:yes stop_codon:yes gene_type:complete